MSDVVIRAEGLGKKYLIGHQAAGRERYTALRDVVGRQAKSFLRSARDMLQGRQIIAGDEVEEFWALKDVSFEIKRGDVVGIIGRNGAGKSTLLKVLSRITEPSTGRVEIKGRVASLLEVGTGFHPELTGRENIYLNGAILGMSRAEIRRKFDEIVAFAEVEKFLDTPVKRYSSGMYVRLAFAVAAHLEPEILVVDEVLAVGDAEFQKKCLGKMQDVAGHGRTVLFVSHNMGAVQRLCGTGLHLASGAVIHQGEIARVVESYATAGRRGGHGSGQDQRPIWVIDVEPAAPQLGGALMVRLGVGARSREVRELALLLYSANGTRVAIVDARAARSAVLPMKLDDRGCVFEFRISALPLVEGDYSIGAYLIDDQSAGDFLDLGQFSIAPDGHACGYVPYAAGNRGFLELEYEVKCGGAIEGVRA